MKRSTIKINKVQTRKKGWIIISSSILGIGAIAAGAVMSFSTTSCKSKLESTPILGLSSKDPIIWNQSPLPTFTDGGVGGTFTAGASTNSPGVTVSDGLLEINWDSAQPGDNHVYVNWAKAGYDNGVDVEIDFTIDVQPTPLLGLSSNDPITWNQSPLPTFTDGGVGGTFGPADDSSKNSPGVSVNDGALEIDWSEVGSGNNSVWVSWSAKGYETTTGTEISFTIWNATIVGQNSINNSRTDATYQYECLTTDLDDNIELDGTWSLVGTYNEHIYFDEDKTPTESLNSIAVGQCIQSFDFSSTYVAPQTGGGGAISCNFGTLANPNAVVISRQGTPPTSTSQVYSILIRIGVTSTDILKNGDFEPTFDLTTPDITYHWDFDKKILTLTQPAEIMVISGSHTAYPDINVVQYIPKINGLLHIDGTNLTSSDSQQLELEFIPADTNYTVTSKFVDLIVS